MHLSDVSHLLDPPFQVQPTAPDTRHHNTDLPARYPPRTIYTKPSSTPYTLLSSPPIHNLPLVLHFRHRIRQPRPSVAIKTARNSLARPLNNERELHLALVRFALEISHSLRLLRLSFSPLQLRTRCTWYVCSFSALPLHFFLRFTLFVQKLTSIAENELSGQRDTDVLGWATFKA